MFILKIYYLLAVGQADFCRFFFLVSIIDKRATKLELNYFSPLVLFRSCGFLITNSSKMVSKFINYENYYLLFRKEIREWLKLIFFFDLIKFEILSVIFEVMWLSNDNAFIKIYSKYVKFNKFINNQRFFKIYFHKFILFLYFFPHDQIICKLFSWIISL